MGQCICKGCNESDSSNYEPRRSSSNTVNVAAHHANATRQDSAGHHHDHVGGVRPSSPSYRQQLLQTLGLDIRDLIMETLAVIRTLVNNEQEPPPAMLKLNIIADKERGWLMIVQTMIDIIPMDNPLGPAVITLFLDESPLPPKETVCKLLFYLNLSAELSHSKEKSPQWHRNMCIVLGCIAEKLAGPNSVATFKPSTLEYLIANLVNVCSTSLIILQTLEEILPNKYVSNYLFHVGENKVTIANDLKKRSPNELQILESWLSSPDFVKRQVGFCAQWGLDNLFIKEERPFAYEAINTKGINVMLNHNDVSEYLKISPNGLEARCDVSSFESVRCTFQVTGQGVWYYEATLITSGVMQIGWATKDSKFLNHEGYGIGDDEFSVAYDGCRQLIWHNAASHPHSHMPWKAGDVLGCLLDLSKREAMFHLNGMPLPRPHTQVFTNARSGFFAAASFMSFQQCQFNFGHEPFHYLPQTEEPIQKFNDHATLTDEQRIILPRHKKLQQLSRTSVSENACSICCSNVATVTLKPCLHSGLCTQCSLILEICPMCRRPIDERVDLEPIPEDAGEAAKETDAVAEMLANASLVDDNPQESVGK